MTISNGLIARIKELATQWRPYAPHSWAPEQALQEVEMVRRLSEAMGSNEDPFFRDLRKFLHPSGKTEPPDVTAKDRNGSSVAFEVRELVDQRAIEENVRRFRRNNRRPSIVRVGSRVEHIWTQVYRSWTPATVLDELRGIIADKEDKLRGAKRRGVCFDQFDRVILVIHTGEPDLDPDRYIEVVREHLFARPEHVHEAYLVFSYSPASQGYPYAALRFE
ncbi:MAG: hypothetical protein WCF16_01890 [Alphaproteobacteria bacterium]